MHISYTFFLWFFSYFVKSFNISETLHSTFIAIDAYAMFLLFHSIAKLKSALNDKPRLNFRKFVNVLLLLVSSVTMMSLTYGFIENNNMVIDITSYSINILLLLLMVIHFPNFKEYKLIKISVGAISVGYLMTLVELLTDNSNMCITYKVINNLFRFPSFAVLLFFLYRIYNKSIDKEIKKHLN